MNPESVELNPESVELKPESEPLRNQTHPQSAPRMIDLKTSEGTHVSRRAIRSSHCHCNGDECAGGLDATVSYTVRTDQGLHARLTVELDELSSVPSSVPMHPSGESAQSPSAPSEESTVPVELELSNGFAVAFTVTHPDSEQTLFVSFAEPVDTVTFAQKPEASQ